MKERAALSSPAMRIMTIAREVSLRFTDAIFRSSDATRAHAKQAPPARASNQTGSVWTSMIVAATAIGRVAPFHHATPALWRQEAARIRMAGSNAVVPGVRLFRPGYALTMAAEARGSAPVASVRTVMEHWARAVIPGWTRRDRV